MKISHSIALFSAALVATGGAALGCSAAGDGPGQFDPPSGSGGLLFPGAGGNGSGGELNGIPNGGSNGGRDCGGDSYDARPVQLDIYMMFDNSGSMVPWWFGVLDVVNQFLDDPQSAGIGVGIQYFGNVCDANHYATPAVPIAPLPGNAAAIKASYPLPFSGTATEPALRGALQQARAWQAQHTDHKVVVMLITDGLPSDCLSTVPGVSAVAAEGVSGSPSIPTFVLGLGFALTQLNEVAAAGGTSQAVIADPTNAQQLAQAMNQIRGAALPCDYALPADGNVDRSKVNLKFTAADGATVTVANVTEGARCDAAGGWYYDNPAAPTRIIACPATCSTFKGTVSGKVNVVVGCETVVR